MPRATDPLAVGLPVCAGFRRDDKSAFTDAAQQAVVHPPWVMGAGAVDVSVDVSLTPSSKEEP